jgi:hypothetical protein
MMPVCNGQFCFYRRMPSITGDFMSEDLVRDEVPTRMLSTPAKPVTPKAKPKANPGRPATKAEHAALKRVDKTVIKRMRKR